MKAIIVSNLCVESVSGPTCYASEGGFSALTAYVQSDDPSIVTQLRKAASDGVPVTVRCAKLEIEGRIGNLHVVKEGMKRAIAISIDELRYFKEGKRETESN